MSSRKNRRFSNEINAGSMADIAFLLLIFFLVTTTILMDKGIMVKLPPWDPNSIVMQPPAKNVLSVKVNASNQLLVRKQEEQIDNLRSRTKEFIMNPQRRADMPSSPNRAIVALQNDRGTSYKTYLEVYNEIKAAYNELWNEAAQRRYGAVYADLDITAKKSIRSDIPLVISESEPTDLLPQN